jgi:CheY-like chemotaxis protein
VQEEKSDILIVDDLPEKLLVFKTILEELDQNLILVRSGSEALREILQREFAVILLDVNMPDIDGLETARLIRRTRRSSSSPPTPTRCRPRRATRLARWTTSSRR